MNSRIFASDEHTDYIAEYLGIPIHITNMMRVIVCMTGNLYFPVASLQAAKLMVDNYIDVIRCN